MIKFLKEIALAVALIAFLFSANAYFASAQTAIPSGIPFGGVVGSYVPANPACPIAHSMVFDLVSLSVIGIAVIPGNTQVYLKGNVNVPGVYFLGTYIPAPFPCLLPYPVVPGAQIGTS